MYELVLTLHNLARWVALILGIVVCVRAFTGWFRKREWREIDRKFGSYFAMSMDVQLLLGLLLYFLLSPITTNAFRTFMAAMQVRDVAFFLIEHPIGMILAVVFAHLGSTLARNTPDTRGKFKRAAIFFTLAVLLIIGSTPWERPLFPGLG